MKYILCGVDGVGKTTIANRIMNENPDMEFEIVHCTRTTPNDLDYFLSILQSKKNIIMDRAFYGQFVYQKPDERKLSLNDLIMLQNVMKCRNDIKLMYVYTDPESALYNCKKDSEDSYYTLDYIKDLDSRFRELFNIMDSPVEYVYNKIPIDKVESEKVDPRDFDYSTLPTIWGVDFDDTIASNAFPDISKAVVNTSLIYDLKTAQENGVKLVLWSCRTGQSIIDACNLCADYGLHFDAINDNIPEISNVLEGGGPRKLYADLYIDDKAVDPNTFFPPLKDRF